MPFAAHVKYCDIAIIGAGIAGVSIAERLAREAARQGLRIKILVIDEAAEVGTGASGGLEGILHAGTLYSRLTNGSLFFTFLSSLEDLYNWYHFDLLFPHWERCNLHDVASRGAPTWNFATVTPAHWFLQDLPFLLPSGVGPGYDEHAIRYDLSEWHKQIGRARAYVSQAFYGSSWANCDFRCCQAPHEHKDVTVPEVNQLAWTFSEWLDFLRTPSAVKAHSELRAKMSRIVSAVKAAEAHDDIDVMCGRDAVMNPWRVLADLTDAAVYRGVEFLNGYKLESDGIQLPRSGPPDRLDSLVLISVDDGLPLHVTAQQYVLAVGAEFQEASALRERVDLRVRAEKKTSVMLVGSPALCDSSFVRTDYYRRNDFSHVYRPWLADGKGPTFSIMADSHALPAEAKRQDCARAAARLIEKARVYFGHDLPCETLAWFSCEKTEFPEDEYEDRNYSYWWGPSCGEWTNETWRMARQRGSQKETQAAIKKAVISGGVRELPEVGRIEDSSWALKKALHFALQRVVHTGRRAHRGEARAAREVFGSTRSLAAAAFSAHQRSDARVGQKSDAGPVGFGPNFLCAVPGKFSLFPSLAHNIYLELEVRGLFTSLPSGAMQPSVRTPGVAVPRGESVLARFFDILPN